MHTDTSSDPHPVAARREDFDTRSGSWLERGVFNHRPWVLGLCLLLTLLLGWQAWRLPLNASFEKTIPTSHPFIVNYLAHRADLAGQGNTLRLVLEARQGTIFDKAYLDALQKINDEVFLIPGVDRPFMKSLWTSNTRWVAVTEEGLDGGPVIPDSYDGSPASLAELRANVERSGEIGQLVAADFRSSSVLIPLLERHPETGAPLDYGALSRELEALRDRHSNEHLQVRITGFAKVVGDLIEGLYEVLAFFVLALLICSGILLAYTRCLRSTALVVACSLVAVVWQFGLLTLLGYALDPYSVLVPFLVFAIGMSHGAQKMNGIMQDIGRGTHREVAARYTFRRLFMAGMTALLCDAVGFAVLMLIRIQVIQDLAVIASSDPGRVGKQIAGPAEQAVRESINGGFIPRAEDSPTEQRVLIAQPVRHNNQTLATLYMVMTTAGLEDVLTKEELTALASSRDFIQLLTSKNFDVGRIKKTLEYEKELEALQIGGDLLFPGWESCARRGPEGLPGPQVDAARGREAHGDGAQRRLAAGQRRVAAGVPRARSFAIRCHSRNSATSIQRINRRWSSK